MTEVLSHPMVYVPGSLTIEREANGRFNLTGNYQIHGTHAADHFQLIYEALEIAAHSTDKFAPAFQAMLNELMEKTVHWDD